MQRFILLLDIDNLQCFPNNENLVWVVRHVTTWQVTGKLSNELVKK